MIAFCSACKEFLSSDRAGFVRGLCQSCCSFLEVDPGPPGVLSLFRYAGPIRQIILNAKVGGDVLARKSAAELFVGSCSVRELAEGARGIIVPQSSLWSRLHGRVDLAWSLGERLSRQTNTPLMFPPRKGAFKLRKEAMKSAADRNVGYQSPPTSAETEGPYTLVVDDIVTTGHTLRNLVNTLPAGRYKYATLARAR